MKKAFFCSLLCCIAILAKGQNNVSSKSDTSNAGPKSITITPAKIAFQLDRGGTKSQVITVSNTTSSKFQLVLGFQDWTRDTLGGHVYMVGGTSPQSCASWVTFDKPFLDMNPGQTQTVTVTLHVPDSEAAVSEMKWTMLVFKATSEKKAPIPGARLQTQIINEYGIGVHIYQTPPNITNKEIKMLSFSQMPGKKNYRIACKNIGGTQLMTKFSMELASVATGEKTTLNSKPIPLFPRQTRFVDFTLPDTLPKGKYTAIALIDANDDDVPIEAAQQEIEVN